MRGVIIIASTVALLALAGGGGSSSGGGGGGGGGGSSSSSWSSSSSSSSSDADPKSVIIFVVIIFGAVITSMVINIRKAKTGNGIKVRYKDKSITVPDDIAEKVKKIFFRYQADWSKNDVEAMQAYMTPEYHHRAELMIKALQQQGRRNEVRDPAPGYLTMNQLTTDTDNLQVTFCGASADDVLIDTNTNTILKQGKVSFTETWEFAKNKSGEFLLAGTMPATAEERMSINNMRTFAAEHKLEYFLDWGTLTLPTRGVIFDKGSFTGSDINNYMVGEYNKQLIQMYSYTPNVNFQVNNKPYPIYLVGQIAVPGKNYGGIIVMKNKLINRKPKGYQKYNLEWADFNKKYDVFATDVDKVTSFELLHPAFMAFLHDEINLDFTLEVVDNIIYFYTKADINGKNYQSLLEVLLRAHKELKM